MRVSHRKTFYAIAILMWWLAIHATAGRAIRSAVLGEWWERLPRYSYPQETVQGAPKEVARLHR